MIGDPRPHAEVEARLQQVEHGETNGKHHQIRCHRHRQRSNCGADQPNRDRQATRDAIDEATDDRREKTRQFRDADDPADVGNRDTKAAAFGSDNRDEWRSESVTRVSGETSQRER